MSRALAPLTPAVEAARDRAALAAANLVEDGMIVGLGTGDTSRRFIGCLGQRVKADRLKITCVASSEWATIALILSATLAAARATASPPTASEREP